MTTSLSRSRGYRLCALASGAGLFAALAVAGGAALAEPPPAPPPPAAPSAAPSISAAPAVPSISAAPSITPAPAAPSSSTAPSAAPSPTAPSPTAAPAAPPDAESREMQARREEAKTYFDRGMVFFKEEKWEEALAALLRSRAIYPSRASTRNAALCLYKLDRSDEALEMFEALLGFSDLPDDYRQVAQSAIAELSTRVGKLEIEGGEAGATIVIDGRYRGTLPLPGPLRVKAGSHVIRAFKEGLDTFGATVEVSAGKQAVVQLRSLATGGTLQVTEERGRVLDVVVDGTVVGKSPWKGSLPAGDHLVALRGSVKLDTMAEECAPLMEGAPEKRRALAGSVELGTQPVSVPIRPGKSAILTLTAESLDAWLRVEPTPAGASVAIDSVTVGNGVWEGRLRVGAHKVEVRADGFLPVVQQVTLERRKPQSLAIDLKRDPINAFGSTTTTVAIGAAYGIGALGLAVSGVSAIVAGDMLSGIRTRCGGTQCPEAEQPTLNAVRTIGDVATVSLVAGVIAATLGTILLVDARSSARAAASAPRASGIQWKVGIGPGRIVFGGRF